MSTDYELFRATSQVCQAHLIPDLVGPIFARAYLSVLREEAEQACAGLPARWRAAIIEFLIYGCRGVGNNSERLKKSVERVVRSGNGIEDLKLCAQLLSKILKDTPKESQIYPRIDQASKIFSHAQGTARRERIRF